VSRAEPAAPVSRRRALAALGALGAGAALAPAALHAAPAGAPAGFYDLDAADTSTPAGALAELAAGNARFVGGQVMAPHRNMARLREVAASQKPFAAFLGCADSRVPIEIVFDQGFGDVFPVRVAGNIVTPEVTGSLEFGCAVLGAKVLFVLGHSGCGAVAATIKGDPVPGQISALYQHIAPAVDVAGTDLPAAVAANVRIQAGLLRRSPVIAGLVREGKLAVAGGVYDLGTGRVTMVDARG
jgi:carbonic anhydrase